jgi:hypothetical protein
VDKIVGVNADGMSLADYMGRWPAPAVRLILLLMVSSLASAGESGYVGRDVCAGCHKTIAMSQSRTNMARTWQDPATQQHAANYSETHAEGPVPTIGYELKGTGPNLQFQVQMPGQPAVGFPVETMVGGQRHGISFLFRVPALQGLPLPLSRLLEARYFHYSQQNQLALSARFSRREALDL